VYYRIDNEEGEPVQDKIIELITTQRDEGLKLLQQHYSGLVHYIVGNILQNKNDTEECINDIYLKVWKSIASYSPEKGKFSTWLTVISRNTALNYLKHKYRKHEELQADTAHSSSPEDAVLRRERSEELKRALSMLSFEERHIFYRKYYYLQRTAQIAAELGMTERAIEGRLYRLRKKLQKELGGDFR
jgi:RNA polymerase sigma factor (sigma-70 family)